MLRTTFLYHVFDDAVFNGRAPLASASIPVMPLGSGAKIPRLMYSLRGDMAKLRQIGVQKGIVDAGVTEVGKSAEGRDLLALKLGKGASHKVLVLGCHHAREWISVEMAYYIAEYLITAYVDPPTNDKEKRIKHLLMNREIWFVPMVNPDGHVRTISHERMWRQNNHTHAVPAGSVKRGVKTVSWLAGSYTGVDINRNYAVQASATPSGGKSFLAWGTETFSGGSVMTSRNPQDSDVLHQVWCGPSAASEPETNAIQALIQKHSFRSTISFHNYGEQWLWPGPLTTGSGDGYVDWVGRGAVQVMATVQNGPAQPPAQLHGYTFTGGPNPYLTSGDMIVFVYQSVPAWRPAFTPEVRPADDSKGWEFSGLPESEIENCFKENLGATLAVINCAGHDAKAELQSLNTATGLPPQRCQFVRHCWEVFSGWTV